MKNGERVNSSPLSLSFSRSAYTVTRKSFHQRTKALSFFIFHAIGEAISIEFLRELKLKKKNKVEFLE